MHRILAICVLALMPFQFLSAESAGNNAIEYFRTLRETYDGLSKNEKEDFLFELDITKEAFECFADRSKLDWKMEGTHSLPLSNSTLSIPDGYAIVTGEDAATAYKIGGESGIECLEVYACESSNFGNVVLFQNIKTGYVPLDDWKELNSKDLLEEITQNTEKENKERRKRGVSELHVIGWIQEPTLDLETKTVYWAIEADSGADDNLVNSVAIRLGREGYEEITWITYRSSYVSSGSPLETMLKAHNFNFGYRYNDYQLGDKIAGFGIAGLVAATAGAKALKVGSFGLILKKVLGIVFAGAAALFYKLKNLFKRKKDGS